MHFIKATLFLTLFKKLFNNNNNIFFKDCATKRPFVINVIYNSECSEPQITIKKDSVSTEFDKNVTVKVADLPRELQARNTESDVPVHITYETSRMMNMTFVDTPGLLSDSDSDWERVDATVASSAAAATTTTSDPRSSVALCVERAGAWPSWLSACWARQHKIGLTVGVYTGAHSKFSSFSGPSGMTKYIVDKPAQNANNFFVELPPATAEVAADLRGSLIRYDAAFRARTAAVDRRFEGFLSFERLHAFVFDAVLRGYRQLCPLVRQRYRDLSTAVDRDLADAAQRSAGLSPWSLRSFAMGTFSCYAQLMQALLDGTADSLSAGHVLTLGQTLAEETRPFNGGPWPASASLAGVAPPQPPADAQRPLLGRQQFERLLAEFRAVVAATSMDQVGYEEALAAYGTHGTDTADPVRQNWVSCDIARVRLEAQLKPLVKQLQRRVRYLLCRLSDTAFAVAAFPKFRAAQGPNVSFEYPFFNAWMKELYVKVVDDTVAAFSAGCDEEFYPTQTMAWEASAAAATLAKDDPITAARSAAAKIFEDSKNRIARNVLRSCFYRFLE